MTNSSSSHIDVAAVDAALELLSSLTEKDLIAVRKAHEAQSKPAVDAPAVAIATPTVEEETPRRRRSTDKAPGESNASIKKARKRAQQQAYRATPEGRERANEASKKSHAAARARAEAVKELMAQKVTAQLAAVVRGTTTKKNK